MAMKRDPRVPTGVEGAIARTPDIRRGNRRLRRDGSLACDRGPWFRASALHRLAVIAGLSLACLSIDAWFAASPALLPRAVRWATAIGLICTASPSSSCFARHVNPMADDFRALAHGPQRGILGIHARFLHAVLRALYVQCGPLLGHANEAGLGLFPAGLLGCRRAHDALHFCLCKEPVGNPGSPAICVWVPCWLAGFSRRSFDHAALDPGDGALGLRRRALLARKRIGGNAVWPADPRTISARRERSAAVSGRFAV